MPTWLPRISPKLSSLFLMIELTARIWLLVLQSVFHAECLSAACGVMAGWRLV